MNTQIDPRNYIILPGSSNLLNDPPINSVEYNLKNLYLEKRPETRPWNKIRRETFGFSVYK